MFKKFERLDAREQEIVKRVINKLCQEVVSKEALDRIAEATEKKHLIPPDSGGGWADWILPGIAEQQPYEMAQWHIELRERIIEMLYDKKGEDLEEEIEKELRAEEESGMLTTHSS